MNGYKTLGKKQDRLLAFFDAVLAIAMTMLALEITVPQMGTISHAQRYDFFVGLTCYLISFVALSMLWYVHNNFFSSHDLTGNMEIVLHLVLLFVVTLFQPLTRAIGENPNDLWIRAFYLTDFFVMYGIITIIIVYVRHREDIFSDGRETRRNIVKEKRKEYQRNDNIQMSDEEKELRHLLHIAWTIENPEIVQQKLAKYMPDEYKEQLTELKEKREKSYRLSLISVSIMAVAVLVAVVTLIFSIWYSYIALAAGLVVIFVIRVIAKD